MTATLLLFASRGQSATSKLLVQVVRTVAALGLSIALPVLAQSAPPSRSCTARLLSDGRFAANTVEADAEDIVTSPLHIPDLFAPDGLLHQPKFYYTLLGAGAALGGAFALDTTVRAHLHTMPLGVANGLQDSGSYMIAASGGLLYVYGLVMDEDPTRHDAMTAGESALLAGLITSGLQSGFGRLRPIQGRGAFHFFDHGTSFVSGHATPAFAGAAAVSEHFDNEWYVLLPEYIGAFAVGFGRIGHDAHWLSDIVGAGLVGLGTTELLRYLHKEHEQNPNRFRVFPVVSQESTGVVVALEW